MSDIAKWGLLVAGAIAVIGLIFATMSGMGFELSEAVDLFATAVDILVQLAGNAFTFGRAMINLLFVPEGNEWLMTGFLVYLFTRWFVLLGIKIAAWVYHYIFK